jgi:hypothetical protein
MRKIIDMLGFVGAIAIVVVGVIEPNINAVIIGCTLYITETLIAIYHKQTK